MSKRLFLSSPRFYGIDESIRDAWKDCGYSVVLRNSRAASNVGETIARRLGVTVPFMTPSCMAHIRGYLDRENQEFLKAVRAERPDLVFVIKGDHLFPDTLAAIKQELGIPVVAYIWDDPFCSYAGTRMDEYRSSNFEKGMNLYDWVFVYDTYYVDQLIQRGVKDVSYLPLATDPEKYNGPRPGWGERAEHIYDACFVGTPYPNRVAALDCLKTYDLGVFGDGWRKYFLRRGKMVPSYYRGMAIGEKVVSLYRSAKIVLNIHDPEARNGANTRTFDILACGGSELVDFRDSLAAHFIIGEEIVCYHDLQELGDLVAFFSRNELDLRRIAAKGRERVLREHTWRHRIAQAIVALTDKGLLAA